VTTGARSKLISEHGHLISLAGEAGKTGNPCGGDVCECTRERFIAYAI
jgi:hypothetical protein